MPEIITIREGRATGMERAAASLERGELVCLPADTVYGLACLPGRPEAMEALYLVKGREQDKPVALMFAEISQIEEAVPSLPESVVGMMRALLPGPVTVILPAAGEPRVSRSPGGAGIGARVVPPELAGIYARLPLPLALTSANRSGEPEPLTLNEVPRTVLESCTVAIDGGRCAVGRPTTVIDLRPAARGSRPSIIREGALSRAEVEDLIGECA
jgi:L-threonylcarbamoyladenylate synthase